MKWFDHRQEHEGTEDAGSEERNVGSCPRFLAKTMVIEMRDPKCGPGLPVVAGIEACCKLYVVSFMFKLCW